MGAVPIIMMMMAQQNHRRMEEARRRRMEEERRRRRQREEEERRREEEHRKMVEHRKTSPVVYNNESWQKDRCTKAISLQPSVQTLVSLIDKVRPQIIEREQQKYDQEIIETGYEYEVVRQELDTIIKKLQEMGITIQGEQYRLTRLSPQNTHIARPTEVTERLGSTFTIMNGQPIELSSSILSRESYYEDRYNDTYPETVEREYLETSKRLKKYQAIGKYLRFILKTNKYLELEEHSEEITRRHEICELRKREMQSFQSLTKEQLLLIKSYFNLLAKLSEISERIERLFSGKKYLSNINNERIYELTIQEILSNSEYSELVEQVRDYISRIQSNDEQTMQEAYELVKGQYPIEVSRRSIIDLIITNIQKFKKEDQKELKLN